MRCRSDGMFGFLNLYKPPGITSYQLTGQVGAVLDGTKVGHAGTLDPLAEGVLVLGLGAATRLLDYLHQPPKTYRARFEFGWISDTQDNTGSMQPVPMAPVNRDALSTLVASLVGEQMQTPPSYSAVKISGKRAYRLARKNRQFSLPPRPITLYQIRLISCEYPQWEIEVCCSKGTYIRTLGHDIGQRLGGGAVMTHLTRTKVANFSIEDAWRTNRFVLEEIATRLVPPQHLFVDLPVLDLSTESVEDLRCGRAVNWGCDLERAQLRDPQGRFLGIVQRQPNGQLRYEIHFANYYYDLEK